MTTKKYITDKFGVKKGDFIFIKTGQKVGTHEGFYQYTIGQRKGIGIAWEEPLYVVKLDAQNNVVYVGTQDDLMQKSLTIHDIKMQYPNDCKEFEALVKIRYNMEAKSAVVKLDYENNTGVITFDEPVASITSGQAAVFYDKQDRHLIGGGWID